jgi:hypothetical protein
MSLANLQAALWSGRHWWSATAGSLLATADDGRLILLAAAAQAAVANRLSATRFQPRLARSP